MDKNVKKKLEPSEKVQKMYEAIAAFVEEKRDLSTIRVSEITSRAGIGKGTAYEYFSSKEELIVYATLWLCGQQMERMIYGASGEKGFQEKYFFILEWIETHKEYNELLLKAIKGSLHGDCEKLKDCVPKELSEQIRRYIAETINDLLEQGYQEGIFTEQNVEKRIMVFMGTMMQYGFGVMNLEEGFENIMNREQLREFTYECMVKSLN